MLGTLGLSAWESRSQRKSKEYKEEMHEVPQVQVYRESLRIGPEKPWIESRFTLGRGGILRIRAMAEQ